LNFPNYLLFLQKNIKKMKKCIYFLLVVASVITISCKNKLSSANSGTSTGFLAGNDTTNNIAVEDTMKTTKIQWIDSTKDLGDLVQGGLVDVSFRFKNVGTKPLSINSVSAGCGCTKPEKPDHLIKPGEEGIVKAKFDTKNQNGQVSKQLTVECNTNPQHYTLNFKANVATKTSETNTAPQK
jgi:hypothetical protein